MTRRTTLLLVFLASITGMGGAVTLVSAAVPVGLQPLRADVQTTGPEQVAPPAPAPPPPAGPAPGATEPALGNAPSAGGDAQSAGGSAPTVGAAVSAAESLAREHSQIHVGEDFTLPSGSTASDVVVVGGSATIEGRVTSGLVVVGGLAVLSPTAVIDGDLVVFGRGVRIAEGATVGGDTIIVGGPAETAASFQPGGERVVVGLGGLGGLGEMIAPLLQWVGSGLLMGRPFVPTLGWMWGVALIALLFYLLVAVLFQGPVGKCVAVLENRPATAFLAGLLVLLLVGPVALLLFVSVVGLLIVPFLMAAMLAAGLVGRVAVASWVGGRVLRVAGLQDSVPAAPTFVTGFVVVCLTYMIPLVGLLIWTMVGVLGLGTVALALISTYREENPRPAPSSSPSAPGLGWAAPGGGSPPTPELSSGASAYGGLNLGPEPLAAGAAAAATAGFAPAMVGDEPVRSRGMQDMAAFPRASFLVRLGAFVLDVLLVFMVVAFVNGEPHGAFFPLFFVYRIAAWSWKSVTLGGVICRLRVTRLDGKPLELADAVVRGLASVFSLVVFGLGCLWVLRDDERQSWHDRVAGTYVVSVPRDFPL